MYLNAKYINHMYLNTKYKIHLKYINTSPSHNFLQGGRLCEGKLCYLGHRRELAVVGGV